MVYDFLSVDDAIRASNLAKTLGPRGAQSVLDVDRLILQDNVPTAAFDDVFENALRQQGIALIKAAVVKI